jgi:hypothetical protein
MQTGLGEQVRERQREAWQHVQPVYGLMGTKRIHGGIRRPDINALAGAHYLSHQIRRRRIIPARYCNLGHRKTLSAHKSYIRAVRGLIAFALHGCITANLLQRDAPEPTRHHIGMQAAPRVITIQSWRISLISGISQRPPDGAQFSSHPLLAARHIHAR